jgi:hypothetical protein
MYLPRQMIRICSLMLIALFTGSHPANAQELFVEGTIVYSVSIGPVGSGAGFTEHAGTYTITVKGDQLRKELRMNSGYQNVIIQNNNTSAMYSLQPAAGQNYAIQLRLQDIKERQRPYEGFAQKDEEGPMTIAGQPCQKARVTYKDGTTSSVYYTTRWTSPDPLMFDRFPGIKYIPLKFEYRNEEGITMHFAAERIESKPVESGLFRVPPDYKIITNAEYKALSK